MRNMTDWRKRRDVMIGQLCCGVVIPALKHMRRCKEDEESSCAVPFNPVRQPLGLSPCVNHDQKQEAHRPLPLSGSKGVNSCGWILSEEVAI